MDTRDYLRAIYRVVTPLKNAMRGLVRRGVLGSLNVAGQGSTFQASTTANDVDDGVELMQAHGFWSTPPDGAEGVVLRIGGSRACSVGVCFGARGAKPGGLQQGDTAVYNDQGTQIILRANGNIEVTPGGAGLVQLGGPTSTDHLVLAEQIHNYFINAITAAAVSPLDGGATFKANLLVYLAANPFTTYATQRVTAQ